MMRAGSLNVQELNIGRSRSKSERAALGVDPGFRGEHFFRLLALEFCFR